MHILGDRAGKYIEMIDARKMIFLHLYNTIIFANDEEIPFVS